MNTTRVLIVEDESIVALDLETRLDHLGYQVLAICDTGEAAVQRAEELKPDLILMNIKLKGQMDGIDAASQIRKQFEIPVIFLTANADQKTLQRAKESSHYGYLVKPFQEIELRATFEMALVKHKAEGALRAVNEQLEARVSERTIDLANANQRLEKEIEERKHAENRWRILFKSAPDAYFLTDLKWTIMEVNTAAEELVQYPSSKLVGVSFLDLKLIPDSQLSKASTLMARLALGRTAGLEELTIRREGGESIPVEITAHLIELDGRHLALTLARDISHRKRAERILHQRNSMLEILNELSRDVSVSLKVDPILDIVARVAAQGLAATSASVHGWNPDNCSSVVLAEYFAFNASPEEQETRLGMVIEESTQYANWLENPESYSVIHLDQEKASPDSEKPIIVPGTRSSLTIPLHAGETPIGCIQVRESREQREFSSEEINLLQAIARQVSQSIDNAELHAQVLHQLKEQERLWQIGSAIASETDSRVVLDLIVQNAVELTGAETGLLCLMTDAQNHTHITNTQGDLQTMTEQLPNCDTRLHGEVLREGKPLLVEDALNDPRLKDNGAKPQFQSAMITPLRIKNQALGALSVFSVSEKKLFSEHDLQLLVTFANYAAISFRNANLYKASQDYAADLEELAKELSAANVQLQNLSQVKDEFVSNVSHEFRTPLTALKLYHDLLLVKPSEAEKYIDTLQRETIRLEKLIEDLLQLSRLDQTKELPEFTSLDLGTLVTDLVKDRVPMAESRELTLKYVPSKKLPPVSGNEHLIGQTLSILLTNAMNYTPTGGEIDIRTDRSKKNGRVCVGISVEDTGPGISPEEQERIFERFYRGKVGRESTISGTGLGLSIAYEIVHKHGGEINVESLGEEGKGAKFQIWLPASGEE